MDSNVRRQHLLAALIVFCLASITYAENKTEAAAKNPSLQSEQAAAEKSLLATANKNNNRSVVGSDVCQCINVDLDAALRIEQALSKPVTRSGLDYADTPLADVIQHLASETGLPLMLDRLALEEAGVGTDAPVTFRIRNVSLRSALRLLLKNLGLTYIIENEVLLITTNEGAEKNDTTCVYDVRSITSEREEKPTEILIKTIQSCIARDTWAANGRGQAEINAVKPGVLVITQTQAVHQQIQGLLATIKRVAQNRPAENKTSSNSEPKVRTSEPPATFATRPSSGDAAPRDPSSSVAEDPFP